MKCKSINIIDLLIYVGYFTTIQEDITNLMLTWEKTRLPFMEKQLWVHDFCLLRLHVNIANLWQTNIWLVTTIYMIMNHKSPNIMDGLAEVVHYSHKAPWMMEPNLKHKV